MTTTAYLSLGSNIGDRENNLRDAIERLATLGTVSAQSSFYETEPVEIVDQPWFLNCAVELTTEKTAPELLAGVLEIELAMGRERNRPKGPRNIDIDILLFGNAIINSAGLTIPHPGLAERLFVLEPMVEIAPDVVHPLLKQTMRELRNIRVSEAPIVRRQAEK
jgi:2-amino-4-hydroxy-6-hydroxymethyldihydropteridine diphosphokinase